MEKSSQGDGNQKPAPEPINQIAAEKMQVEVRRAQSLSEGFTPANAEAVPTAGTERSGKPIETAPHPQPQHSEAPATAAPEPSSESLRPSAEANNARTGPAGLDTSASNKPARTQTDAPTARSSDTSNAQSSQSSNPFLQLSQTSPSNTNPQRSEASRADGPPPANAIGSGQHRDGAAETANTGRPVIAPPEAAALIRASSVQPTDNRAVPTPREAPPPAAKQSRADLASTVGDRQINQPEATPAGAYRATWYEARRQSEQTSNQIQKAPSAGATATLEGSPQSKNAPVGPNPFINGPEHNDARGAAKAASTTSPDHAGSFAAQPGEKPAGVRNSTDGAGEHLIADGKGGGSKVNSWLDEPDHGGRKPEAAQPGQIAYGGVTPDGREHPFGLAGRVLEPKADAPKGQPTTANLTGADGRGVSGGGLRPDVGLIPQILGGQAGWKPNIKLPFGGKSEKETKEADETGSGGAKEGRKQTIAEFVAEKVRKQTAGDATAGDGKPTRRSADGSLLDATMMENKIGKPSRRTADGTPLDATMMEVKDAKPTRRTADGAILDATMHESNGAGRKQTETSVAAAFIGIVESVKGGIASGIKASLSDRQSEIIKTPASAANTQLHQGELVLTGVKTKAPPQNMDGSITTTVAVLSPFLIGGGLKVSKNPGVSAVKFGQPHDQTVVNTALNAAGAEASKPLGTTSSDNSVVPLLDAKGEDVFAARILEEGRLKSRPSVNLHVPGGKHALKGEGIDEGEIATHGKDSASDNKPKPYLTFGGGTSYADQNLTVEDMSIPPLPLAEFEIAHAAAEAANERVKVTKSIDELEVTDQMSAKAREELQKRVRDDRYLYIVQDGDTIESIAATVLKAPQLAPLLFSLNRKYVLPEIMYGVHPLMVGVVLQLPTPSDILKFGQ